jgi:hypothetical protein
MSGELKHKMHDYEVNPPQGVWNSIAEELQEHEQLVHASDQHSPLALVSDPGPSTTLATKMHAYKVTPPASVWRNIIAALKAGAPSKVIASQKIYRWSAAAAVILLAGGYYFLNYSDTARNIVHTKAAANTANENGQTNPDSYSSANNGKAALSAVRLTSSTRYNREKIYDDEEDIKILPLSYVEDTDPLTGDDQTISVTPRPILTSSGELIQDKSVINPHNDEYISITAPNGQQTKISSRLINAMHYFASSNNTEKKEAEGDNKKDAWQQRINQWRKKVLQSAFIPSSSNFLDILEMTELVEEKEQ